MVSFRWARTKVSAMRSPLRMLRADVLGPGPNQTVVGVLLQDMGGPARDVTRRVATDNAGNVYAAGVFNGTAQFGTSNGTDPVHLTSAGSSDNFLMKVTPAGHTAWVRQATGAAGRRSELRLLRGQTRAGRSPAASMRA